MAMQHWEDQDTKPAGKENLVIGALCFAAAIAQYGKSILAICGLAA
jgi:hypothetical protein